MFQNLCARSRRHTVVNRGKVTPAHSSLFGSGDGWVNNTINVVKGATPSHRYPQIDVIMTTGY